MKAASGAWAMRAAMVVNIHHRLAVHRDRPPLAPAYLFARTTLQPSGTHSQGVSEAGGTEFCGLLQLKLAPEDLCVVEHIILCGGLLISIGISIDLLFWGVQMQFSIFDHEPRPISQREIITASHFGVNLLITNIPTGSITFTSSSLPAAISALGGTNLRYPGGSVTEHYFSMTNPNNSFGNGNRLIPQSEFLAYCASVGAEANMVLPTISGFTQTAAQALMAGNYGHRVISDIYLATVTDYVRRTMLDAYAQQSPVTIKSFEIGNEFWGSGQMTAAEYGRLAAAVLSAAEDGINQAIVAEPRVATMDRPELLVQSFHTTGGFSPNAAREAYVANGVVYLGSGLIDHIQKMTMAAMAIADMKVWAQRSYRV